MRTTIGWENSKNTPVGTTSDSQTPYLVTFVGFLPRSMYHDLMSPIVGDAGKILFALVASVQNARFFVHGRFVPLQVVARL